MSFLLSNPKYHGILRQVSSKSNTPQSQLNATSTSNLSQIVLEPAASTLNLSQIVLEPTVKYATVTPNQFNTNDSSKTGYLVIVPSYNAPKQRQKSIVAQNVEFKYIRDRLSGAITDAMPNSLEISNSYLNATILDNVRVVHT